jgi:hypothetical protein
MVSWEAYHGKSGDFHQSKADSIGQTGFRIVSLSVTGSKGHRRYAAVWAKDGGPPQRSFHGRTANEYQDIFESWTKDGFRPTILTATGFPPSYAGVFEKSSTPFLARHGITTVEFTNTSISARDDGLILRWAAIYGEITESGGGLSVPLWHDNILCAGIWEANPAGVDWVDSLGDFFDLGNGSEFQKLFDIQAKKKRRLAFVTVTGRQGIKPSQQGHHYFGIFRSDSIGPSLAHHGMTADEYQAKLDEHKKQGFMPIVVQAHGQVNNIRYAAIFAKQVP